MWKRILTPSSWCNELCNCYNKYSNYLYYIDTQLINVAYMKFANICSHSIKNYLRMSKWCVSFFAGYIFKYYQTGYLLFNKLFSPSITIFIICWTLIILISCIWCVCHCVYMNDETYVLNKWIELTSKINNRVHYFIRVYMFLKFDGDAHKGFVSCVHRQQ